MPAVATIQWWLRGRRPLVVLTAAAFAWLFVPLLGDWLWLLLRPVKWYIGQTLFTTAALGAAWFALRRPPPTVLSDAEPKSETAARWEEWAAPLLLYAAVLAAAVGLFRHPDGLPNGDWDVFVTRYEALRRTILLWGEFPWWTPWRRGGFPLASDPQTGLFSLATPLVLLFGASIGLRLAAVAYLLVAAEGARRLAKLFARDPWAAAFAGLVFALNGAVVVYVAAGLYVPMSFCWLPWILRGVLLLERSPRRGVELGVWGALLVNAGVQYPSVYTVLLAGLLAVHRLYHLPPAERRRFLLGAVLAVGVVFATSGWRLATTALLVADFPRDAISHIAHTWRDWLDAVLHRTTPADLASVHKFDWETPMYLGPTIPLLALVGLAGGWRWLHGAGLVCAVLAMGNDDWYEPGAWIQDWPIFSSMHMATRWRVPLLLFVGLSAAVGVDRLRAALASARLTRRAAAFSVLAAAVVAAADLADLAADLPAVGFAPNPETRPITAPILPGAPKTAVAQLEEGNLTSAIGGGYGVVRSQEPLLGYKLSNPTARRWLGGADYRGEAWSDDGPVETVEWTPNRIILETAPGALVFVNQNPGDWWTANGARPFEHFRCVEWNEPFTARADAAGRLTLQISPKGTTAGAILHVVGLAMLFVLLKPARRPRRI
ncbi:MAG: hypothetical protein ACRC1K_08780 [Planctomycetia bacterium]